MPVLLREPSVVSLETRVRTLELTQFRFQFGDFVFKAILCSRIVNRN